MNELLLRSVEVQGRACDVRVRDGMVGEVGRSLVPGPGAEVIDGAGGALLPGLHDHHIHLMATAALEGSVRVGPAEARSAAALSSALRSAPAAGRWVRAVGYHESVAGPLDRDVLDGLLAHRPVRVQHRSGARWYLNSLAVEELRLDEQAHPGVEREESGRVTGVVHRADAWLRSLLPDAVPPALGPLGRRLAAVGVTGVTDMTPYSSLDELEPLSSAACTGALGLRVIVSGGPELAGRHCPDGLEWGPVKLVIDDAQYPPVDELVAGIAAAHGSGRAVAIHCVTRAALTLALVAWDAAGAVAGDRIEHGSVIPPDLFGWVRRHGLAVVTQPGFVRERGDAYLRDVEPPDLPHLYRCRSLIEDGIPVAASSDAPYSDPDPWSAMRAAVDRRAPDGTTLGPGEAVAAPGALRLFLSDPHRPGLGMRRVEPGVRADLCLLDRPLADALRALDGAAVVVTVVGGRLAQ